MMDERKYRAIQLMVENQHNKTEIAEILGIARSTLYDWMNDEEFSAELDKCLQKIQLLGENSIKSNVENYIKNVAIIANTAESEKTKLEANTYLIDRVLGKTTTKLADVTDRTNENDFDIDDFLSLSDESAEEEVEE